MVWPQPLPRGAPGQGWSWGIEAGMTRTWDSSGGGGVRREGEGLQPFGGCCDVTAHIGEPRLMYWGGRAPPSPTVTHSWGGRGAPSIQCQPWGPRRAPTQEYLVTGYLVRKS